jgi:hypothetical protein
MTLPMHANHSSMHKSLIICKARMRLLFLQADRPAAGCGKCLEVVCADGDVRPCNCRPSSFTPVCSISGDMVKALPSCRHAKQSRNWWMCCMQPNCPVVDSCPNCTATQINLSYLTFTHK